MSRRQYYATIEAEAERYVRVVLGHEPTPDELEELHEVARHADPGDLPDTLCMAVRFQRADRQHDHRR